MSKKQRYKKQEVPRSKTAGGSTIYFNGHPCPYGHNEGRYLSNGGCIVCRKLGMWQGPGGRKSYDLKRKIKNPEYMMWKKAKSRANKFGLIFTIGVEDIYIPKLCPILRVPLSFKGHQKQNSPSLDRINNDLGYLPHNIAVISNRANAMKSNMSFKEIERMFNYVKKTRKSTSVKDKKSSRE